VSWLNFRPSPFSIQSSFDSMVWHHVQWCCPFAVFVILLPLFVDGAIVIIGGQSFDSDNTTTIDLWVLI
jgi:hypothetical protein